jgi:CHAD domain-containing protein
MASVTTLAGPQPEHRGLIYWMDRVLKELDHVRTEPETDAVHDLRVAIRRCRSVAAVFQEVDPDPAWAQLRRVPKKLFRKLGELRDTQVMDEWVKKLAPADDPIRAQLQTSLENSEADLRQRALNAADKFDDKAWKRLGRKLDKRSRLVRAGSLAAQCLAVERFEEAKELHNQAQRTDKAKPWHELRIGLKRLRYTVENLLPEHYEQWSDDLKRLQDLLGEIHDLDVLAAMAKHTSSAQEAESHSAWDEIIQRERAHRVDTYRQLTLGKTSMWNDWRQSLPQGNRLGLAAMARLRVTARATDTHPRRTAQISRIAMAVFHALRRAHAAPALGDRTQRRILGAAARLQRAGETVRAAPGPKATRRFLRQLPVPPSWTFQEWDLLAWTVRYHRGAEPGTDRGAFAKIPEEMQRNIRALAGILRLARGLRRSGVDRCDGMRAEKSLDAIVLHVPGLVDSVETAVRLATAKHFLETYLGVALVLRPAPKPEKVVALLAEFRDHQLPAVASD